MSFLETLSKEQIEALLSLVPALTRCASDARNPKQGCNGRGEGRSDEPLIQDATPHFTNAEMFVKKKQNTRATPAQTYLLVSYVSTYVHVMFCTRVCTLAHLNNVLRLRS